MKSNDDALDETLVESSPVHIPLPALEVNVGLVILGALSIYLYQAYALPAPLNAMDIGAGGFPILLGIGTLLCLVPMLIIALYHMVIGGQNFGIVITKRPFYVLATMAVLVVEVVLFEKIGVLICVGISSLLIMLACGERRYLHLIGVPVLLTAFIYFVFVLFLNVRL